MLVICVLVAPPQGADAATCALTPELRGVTVNQGLGSFTPLVRGKETLFRAFLGKPKCALSGDSIAVTGSQLKLSSGATVLATITAPTPVTAPTYALVAAYASAPVADWPGDPIFVIPGNALAPASIPTAAFSVTFALTLNYTSKTAAGVSTNGTSTFTTLAGSTAALSANVDRKSSALRVLVQPMGDPTKTIDTQFSALAQRAVQDGMVTLSRIAPVPDGIGSLTGTSGGVRYTINTGVLDITSFLVSQSPRGTLLSAPKFCGTGANFDVTNGTGVKAKLDQFLQAWNAANPTYTADRILGAVDEAISIGGTEGCAEGMAAVNGKQAWTRALYSTTPSNTGALTTMEIFHTGGAVPTSRADPYNPWHSKNVAADGTSPSRAYNVAQRAYLGTNKTVMDFTSAWNNTNTLAESDDYALWRCLLGGTTTAECATAGTVGTSTGVGANATLTATGNAIINLATGALVSVSDTNTYFTSGMARTPSSASQLQVVQINDGVNPSATVRSDPCPLSLSISDHDESATPTTPPSPNNTAAGSFLCAYPFDSFATLIRLVTGTTVLYERRLRAQAPQVGTTTVSGGDCGNFSRFDLSAGSSPFKITSGPDGKLWFTEYAADKIVKSTTAGALTEYDISHWASTPDMSSGRAGHTATLLPNGSVLVVGGFNGSSISNAAEIYKPSTNTWSAAASMSVGRRYHTATLLTNGTVLVTGGQSDTAGWLSSAEVYDPGTNVWTPTSNTMSIGRNGHTATLLPSGKVLIAGGLGTSGARPSNTELYDPGTNAFAATGDMSGGRTNFTATALSSGNVLVTGGYGGPSPFTTLLSSAELYDAAAGTWAATGSMGTARADHIAAPLYDGSVLVAGGRGATGLLASAEIYNPTAGTWSATASLNSARAQAAAATLDYNGTVLVVAGQTGATVSSPSAEVFDTFAHTWSSTSSLGTGRVLMTETVLVNGTVLVVGGNSAGTTSSAELWAPYLAPNDIAVGPDGKLWATLAQADRIMKVTTSGAMTQYIIPRVSASANAGPRSITTGPDGNLWFTESSISKIGRVTPSGVFTDYLLAAESDPRGIVSGPDGNLWFTEWLGNRIGKITPGGTITEFTVPTANGRPLGITVGGDGRLWFTESVNQIGAITTSGTFTEYPIATASNSDPEGIALGPDGNVWFAESSLNAIARITPAGVITPFSNSDSVMGPFALVTGPDNAIWFTQFLPSEGGSYNDALGRLTLCGTQHAVVSTSIGSAPDQGRLDVFSCTQDVPAVCYPIAVAISPDSVNATDGTATFKSNFSTDACAGGTIRFIANNGIQQGPPKDLSTTCQAKPPVASVSVPVGGQTFLSYDVIPLRGTGTSNGTPLPGSALQFSTNIPGVGTLGAGETVDLTPPSGGWPVGGGGTATYTISLVATGANGLTDTASATITVQKDSAHVGKSDAFVNALTCKPIGITAYEPFADWDGDGIPNVSDPDICNKATTYTALAISFPQKITVPTSLSSYVVGMVVPYRTVESVKGTTVRIVKVAGRDVSANPLFVNPSNLGWSVNTIPPGTFAQLQSQIAGLSSDKFGAIAFDAKKIVQFVQANGLVNHSVAIEFQVQSQGTTPIWTANGIINVYFGSN